MRKLTNLSYQLEYKPSCAQNRSTVLQKSKLSKSFVNSENAAQQTPDLSNLYDIINSYSQPSPRRVATLIDMIDE